VLGGAPIRWCLRHEWLPPLLRLVGWLGRQHICCRLRHKAQLPGPLLWMGWQHICSCFWCKPQLLGLQAGLCCMLRVRRRGDCRLPTGLLWRQQRRLCLTGIGLRHSRGPRYSRLVRAICWQGCSAGQCSWRLLVLCGCHKLQLQMVRPAALPHALCQAAGLLLAVGRGRHLLILLIWLLALLLLLLLLLLLVVCRRRRWGGLLQLGAEGEVLLRFCAAQRGLGHCGCCRCGSNQLPHRCCTRGQHGGRLPRRWARGRERGCSCCGWYGCWRADVQRSAHHSCWRQRFRVCMRHCNRCRGWQSIRC